VLPSRIGDGTTGVWQAFDATWNSGSATSVTINTYCLTLFDLGSHFALDDISLNGPSPSTATPEPGSVVLVLTGGLALCAGARLKRRRVG
jgi:hypothetical protein